MFDRLVCMNGGNPREDFIDHKDPEKAMVLEKSPEWPALSVNHLEGRTAGFFCYGDEGADEMTPDGYPTKLRHLRYFDPADEPFADERDAYRPLVWQCRFSGIEVPDDLWAYCTTGKGKPYADDQAEDMVHDDPFMAAFDRWTDAFAAFVTAKGKVEPGRWRAYGYEAPGHRWADAKLKWRAVRIGLGMPPAESSPAEQQQLGLNQDATLRVNASEGQKLRD